MSASATQGGHKETTGWN